MGATLALVFAYYHLSKKEESDMVRMFGEEYRKYVERTPMFIPRLKRTTYYHAH